MKTILIFAVVLFSSIAFAQETILNSPSADILDKKQIYLRLDSAEFASPAAATITPNFIFGLGHGVEAGVNINTFGVPADLGNRAIVPNFKWKFLGTNADKPIHVDLFLGDQVFVPTFHRTFDAGNYSYAAGAITLHNDTRITGGGWDSIDVIANGNRSGVLLGLERTISHVEKRNLVTLAADWQSGQGSNGTLALGVMYFPTSRLMLIPTFQIANSGNHTANGAILFLGYLLRK